MIATQELGEADFDRAAALIQRGKLVVFPTETVFGLGANALSPSAVRSIFTAKGRPQDNPLIVHLASLADLDQAVCNVSRLARFILESFSPGPITVIMQRHPDLAPEVSAGLQTVGIRIPACPVAHAFLAACRVPVAAPSANRSGRPSPTNFAMAWGEMQGRVDAVMHGPDSSVGLESTIVWPENEGLLHILRPGSVSPEKLRNALDQAGLQQVLIRQAHQAGEEPNPMLPSAPGTRYRHYCPQAAVHLFSSPAEFHDLWSRLQFDPEECAVLTIGDALTSAADSLDFIQRCRISHVFSNPRDYSRALYRSLVEADALACRHILAALPLADDIGLALRDRLQRAAGQQG